MIASLLTLLDSLPEPVIVTVLSVRGVPLQSFQVEPPPAGHAPPAAREDDQRDCHADILAVLHDAGRRLTAEQILSDLEARGWVHGESTVRHHLAAMTRAHVLSSDNKARPPGYSAAG